MAPIQDAFVLTMTLIKQRGPTVERAQVHQHLLRMMDLARDAGESGAVATFAASVLLYMHAKEGGEAKLVEKRAADLELQARALTAILAARRDGARPRRIELKLVTSAGVEHGELAALEQQARHATSDRGQRYAGAAE
ncbi:MAG: hypothetical protein JWN07_1008 [Hyphomicrobiales bacterium]|nr:hypothetical protein [Hyphomicrobiales bacterium]